MRLVTELEASADDQGPGLSLGPARPQPRTGTSNVRRPGRRLG